MPPNTNRRNRTSPRLRGFDYTRPGWYFVTICTSERVCLFGDVEDAGMHLNELGEIADEEWRRTASLRENVRLDAYVVMPNHVHGLIGLADKENLLFVDALRDRWDEVCRNTMNGAENLSRWRDEEASSRCRDTDEEIDSESRCRDMARHVPTSEKRQFGKPIAGSLSTIVGAYKSAVSKRINRIIGATGTGHSIWQSRFHDRIIRNAQEWCAIREYIRQNPAKWKEDRFHPQADIASTE